MSHGLFKPAIGPVRQRGKYAACTRLLIRGAFRPANEDFPAAGSVSRTRGVERPGDRERVDVCVPRRVECVVGAANERLQPQRVLARLVEESNSDFPRAGLEIDASCGTPFRVVGDNRDVFQGPFEVVIAAEFAEMDALAINGDFQLMGIFESAHGSEIGPEVADGDGVFAVERKIEFCKRPADCSQRQSFNVPVLRSILPDSNRVAGRAGCPDHPPPGN